jgi:phospho-N-acetylmuramoyl-pentapeptide-transferase
VRSLLAAATISLAFTLFLTPLFIRLFEKLGWGQVIRTPRTRTTPPPDEARHTHDGRRDLHPRVDRRLLRRHADRRSAAVDLGPARHLDDGRFGAVGFIDDYMKVRQQRSLGLSGWRKIVGQVIVAVPFGILALNFPNSVGQTPASPYVSFFRDIPMLSFLALGTVIGWIVYLVWISFLSVAWSNATNLTDGLDGLATGAGIFTVSAYSLVTFWQFQQRCVGGPRHGLPGGCYDTADPMDLTIIAASFVGALVGFLWWNAPKAKIFMGDVGSMAIGGVIAAMAILSRTEILSSSSRASSSSARGR